MGSDWEDTSESKPSPKPPLRQNSFDTVQHPQPHPEPQPAPSATKPILKRRSISQLLSLPASPFFDHEEDIEEEPDEDEDEDEPIRPHLLHTKSDTHISWRSRTFRKDSPPRILAPEHPHSAHSHLPTPSAPSSESSNSTGSDPELSASSGNGGKKKHISFNTFVEQCIAIDKPKPKRRSFVSSRRQFSYRSGITEDGSVALFTCYPYFRATLIDDPPSSYIRYDDDAEVIYEEEHEDPSSFFVDERPPALGSDSDDDDDVIEMRTSSSRSRSSSSSRSRHSKFSTGSSPRMSAPIRHRPSLVRMASSDRERVSIAPIAPTMLKSSGVEDDDDHDQIGEGHSTPVPKEREVELVYVPPSNSIYSLPSTPLLGAEPGYGSYTRERDSYFPNTSGKRSSLSVGSSPMMANQTLADPVPQDPSKNVLANGVYNYFGDRSSLVVVDSSVNATATATNSSAPTEDIAMADGRKGDAYDYFGGPDLGGDYTERRERTTRRKRSFNHEGDDDDGGGGGRSGVMRYAHGGAASVPTGRSSGPPYHSPRSIPSVIVNEDVTTPTGSRPGGSVSGEGEEEVVRGRRRQSVSPPISSSSTSSASVSTSPPRERGDASMVVCGVIPMNTQASPIHEAMEKLGVPFTQTPSDATMVPKMLINGRQQDPCADPSLLSATDAIPSRGRSPMMCPSSHSGSTTTGSYSYSSDSRSESRGRSSTRNSSFSDQDRSGSRSSRGSPLGSISPTGSSVVVGPYGQTRGRDRDGRHPHSHGSHTDRRSQRGSREDGERERGRERTGRRLENSLSPPHAVGVSSPARSGSDMEVYQPYTPELIEARLAKQARSSSPPSSVSGSSVSGSSTISGSSTVSGSSTASEVTIGPVVAAPVPQSPVQSQMEVDSVIGGPRHRRGSGSSGCRASSIPIPSPIPEEDETRSHLTTPVHTTSTSPVTPSAPVATVVAASAPTPTTAPYATSTPTPAPTPTVAAPATPTPTATAPSRPFPSVLQAGPNSPNHSTKSPKSPISEPVTSQSEATVLPTSPTTSSFRGIDKSLKMRGGGVPISVSSPVSPVSEGLGLQRTHSQQQQHHQGNGTLVTRAAEVARGLLGAIWNTGTASS